MTASPPNLTKAISVVFLVAAILVSLSGCRRNRSANSNSNTSPTSSVSGDPEEAKRQAQSLVEKGKELYRNDQDEQAVDIFKQAIQNDPNNAEAHLRLGMSYAALDKKDEADGEYKKAIELFKKKTAGDSKEAESYFYLGEAHSFLHQDEDAVRAYRQATKLNPDDEEAWYRLGMALTRLAQYPEASSAFQKALDIDPNDSRASDGLDNSKEGSQRIKEGKKHAEDMLKKQQENANGNLNSNSNSSAKPTPKRTPRKPW
jgi:tetratricopeptide (TPR) repeat protein